MEEKSKIKVMITENKLQTKTGGFSGKHLDDFHSLKLQ